MRLSSKTLFLVLAYTLLSAYFIFYPASNDHRRLVKRDNENGTFTLNNQVRIKTLGSTGVWSTFGASIRGYLTVQGPISSSDGSISWSTIQPVVLPIIIFAGIIIVFAIFWLLYNITMWIRCCVPGGCCKCCYPCLFFGPKSRRLSFNNKFKAFLAVMVFAFAGVYMAASIMAALSADSFLIAVDNVQQSVNALGTNVNGLLGDIPNLVTQAFNNGSALINSSLLVGYDKLDISGLQDQLSNSVDAIVFYLDAADSNITHVAEAINATVAMLDDITSAQVTLNNTVHNRNHDINTMKTSFTASSSNTMVYTAGGLTTSDTTGTIDFSILVNQLIHMRDTMTPPNAPNLSSIADTISDQYNGLPNLVQTQYNSSTQNAVSSFFSNIDNAKTSVLNSLPVTSMQSTVSDYSNTANSYFTTYVANYKPIFKGVTIGLYTFIGLLMFVMFVGAAYGNPVAIKWGMYPFMFLAIFLCIIGAITLIFSFAGGIVCQATSNPSSMNTYLESFSALTKQSIPESTVQKAFMSRGNCSSGSSIIDIVSNLGFINASDVDFVAQISQQIDNANLDSIADNFNISSVINFGGNSTEQIQMILSLNLTGIDLSSFVTYLGTNPSDTVLNSYISSLTSDISGLTTSDFTCTPTCTGADLSEWKTAANNYVTQIQTALTTYDNVYNPKSASCVSELNDIQDHSHTIGYNANNISSVYSTLYSTVNSTATDFIDSVTTIVVPAVKTFLLDGVQAIQDVVKDNTKCVGIAAASYEAQTGVCIYLLGGFDTVWFSSYLMAFFGFLMTWVFFQAGHKFNRKLLGGGWFGFGGKCRVAPDTKNQDTISYQNGTVSGPEYDPENKPGSYYPNYGYDDTEMLEGDKDKKTANGNGYAAEGTPFGNNIVKSNEYTDDYSHYDDKNGSQSPSHYEPDLSYANRQSGIYAYANQNANGHNPQILGTSNFVEDASQSIYSPEFDVWGNSLNSANMMVAGQPYNHMPEPIYEEPSVPHTVDEKSNRQWDSINPATPGLDNSSLEQDGFISKDVQHTIQYDNNANNGVSSILEQDEHQDTQSNYPGAVNPNDVSAEAVEDGNRDNSATQPVLDDISRINQFDN